MSAVDYQFGIANESAFSTPVTVSRFFDVQDGADFKEDWRRTISDPLRVGTLHARDDKFVPYLGEAVGTVTLDVLSRGFGYWLKHMLGAVATTGPTDSVYTHTATPADLLGTSFTAQLGKPFHPSGTVQPFTYSGCKLSSWTLSCEPEGTLQCELEINAAVDNPATALATASFPASATTEVLCWAGGVVQIGGTNVDVTSISISQDNSLNVDRRFQRGNTAKKEQTGSKRTTTFEIGLDFSDLTQVNRAKSLTRAGALASISATWTGLILAGVSTYPSLQASMASCRFDDWEAPTNMDDGISLKLTGEVETPSAGGNAIALAYKTLDSTP